MSTSALPVLTNKEKLAREQLWSFLFILKTFFGISVGSWFTPWHSHMQEKTMMLKGVGNQLAAIYLCDSKSNADSTDPHQVFQQKKLDSPDTTLRANIQS